MREQRRGEVKEGRFIDSLAKPGRMALCFLIFIPLQGTVL